jgi:CRP-like cAMP-binding protein
MIEIMVLLNITKDRSRIERIIRRELLPKFVKSSAYFSEDFIASLIYNSRLEFYLKNEKLGNQEISQERLYYIHTGIARTFYYDQITDKPVITNIWKKQDTIFDLNSFLNGPDKFEINEMLEEGEVISISFSALEKLLDTFPNMVSIFLQLQAERERLYKYYQRLSKLNVSQKVTVYLQDHPAMIHRINNDIIAAHLGVSRSRFSKAYAVYKRGS